MNTEVLKGEVDVLNKVSSFSIAFVNTSVIAAFCCIYRVGTTAISAILISCALFYGICLFLPNCKANILCSTFISFSSCSYTLLLATKLLSDTKTLSPDRYSILFLVCAVTVCVVALGKPDSLRMNSVFATSICVVVFILLLALSLLDTSFGNVKSVSGGEYPVLQLVAFSVFDFYAVVTRIKHKKHSAMLGGLFLPLYFLVSTVVAVSVMSPKVFESLERPLVSLWSSTYIPSFLNRFEIIGIVSVFLLIIMKSSLMLSNIYDIVDNKFRVLICISVSLFSIVMLFYPFVASVIAVICVVLSAFGAVYGLFTK